MPRRACADLPLLPLQLLLAAHPEWKALPVAVVDADEPGGILLAVNAAAWRSRLRPGLRYASALALEGRLRAGVVPRGEIEAAVASVTEALRKHTPHVEPCVREPGVFWLDASGLERLYPGAEAWARAVARTIAACGFHGRVVAGFTRFGTYALGRTLDASSPQVRAARVLVCDSEDEERRRVREVALERLDLAPSLREALARLGVRRVGQFLDLPAGSIRRRFGEEAAALHQRARGDAWDPLRPLAPEQPLHAALLLDDPVADTGVLLFVVRRLLASLTPPLAARGLGVAAVRVTLHTGLRRDRPSHGLDVRAAAPTLEEALLVDLVRLRLESEARRTLAGQPVTEVEVELTAAPAAADQLRLFHDRTRRDLGAGERALARLRAEFGDGSVVRAVLRQGHLPEAGFAWEEATTVAAPSPRAVRRRPLVRRLEDRPLALPPRPFRERDDCWLPTPAGDGRVEAMTGPYIVSGGWWRREVHREYHYATTGAGELLWVYYDRPRRRWFLAGKVE